jgi:hypothetical protein
MYSRKNRAECEVTDLMIMFVHAVARYTDTHVTCNVLISGKLQYLATLSSQKVPDATTFTVY